jgi:cysteine desulfurase
MESARETIAESVKARAENIVFTSGATEALHLALECAGAAAVIVSAVEHDAVFEHASRRGALTAPVDAEGLIDLKALAQKLAEAPRPALVAIQLANNETGVIQPIAQIPPLVREAGAMLLIDAAQALGRMPLSLADLDATYLVLSSHKAGGPQGAGALVLAPGAPFNISRFGGGQERSRRPGTENVAACAGFGAAVEIAVNTQAAEAKRLALMRDRLEAGLPRDAIVFGAKTLRLPNTSNFALPGIAAETAIIAMDLDGVCVSSGAACSSGKVKSSRVLGAMGVGANLAKSALRISFGWASLENDVDACLAGIMRLASRRPLQGAA